MHAYDVGQVITGASGGSILAALLAIKTEEELLNEVLTEDFSTDFKVRVCVCVLDLSGPLLRSCLASLLISSV